MVVTVVGAGGGTVVIVVVVVIGDANDGVTVTVTDIVTDI